MLFLNTKQLSILAHLKRSLYKSRPLLSRPFSTYPIDKADFMELTSPRTARDLINKGLLIEGRVIQKTPEILIVNNPIDGQPIIIYGNEKNRACHNDIVAVKLNQIKDWYSKMIPLEKKTITTNGNSNTTSVHQITGNNFDDDDEDDATELSGECLLDQSNNQDSLANYIVAKNIESFVKISSIPIDYDHILRPILFPQIQDHLGFEQQLRSPTYAFSLLPSQYLVRSGRIISITKSTLIDCKLIGRIRYADGQKFFRPEDKYYPLIKVSNPNNLVIQSNASYICHVRNWDTKSKYPEGILTKPVRRRFDQAILRLLYENGISHDHKFIPNCLEEIPKNADDFVIPSKEILSRRDLRAQCVFTVDPPSAKDLDDALHITQLTEDTFEVGVHVADVSYFVRAGSPLDIEAANRANSIYLFDRVIPMLPPVLSEKLCSLTPDGDKLAFSVIFKIKSDGTVLDSQITRTVIRPCVQLSYEDASLILKNLAHAKANLNIAQNLRQARLEKGAISLRKMDLRMEFQDRNDSLFGMPIGFSVKDYGLTNEMIEEWMLLANQHSARVIYANKPEKNLNYIDERTSASWYGGLLRRHPEPFANKFSELMNILKDAGISIDLSDKNMTKVFMEIIKQRENLEPHQLSALHLMIYKSMRLALYFSLDDLISNYEKLMKESSKHETSILAKRTFTDPIQNYTHHFGLNVPLYTHFTSPIRRYADLVVHRQLAKILNCESSYKPSSGRSSSINNGQMNERNLEVEKISLSQTALWCNYRRLGSRRLQEKTNSYALMHLIFKNGPFVEKGVVVRLTSDRISIYVPVIGFNSDLVIDRAFMNAKKVKYSKPIDTGKPTLDVHWNDTDKDSQKYTIFSTIKVKVMSFPRSERLEMCVMNPNVGINSIILWNSSQLNNEKAPSIPVGHDG